MIDVKVAGLEESIGTTDNHPFWSEDRRQFIPAGELRIGETLRTALGTSTQVTSITPRGPPETVYNIEVAGEHVYYVTNTGVLVHNACGESFERFGSADEAAQALATQNLHLRNNIPKRLALPGAVKARNLGKSKQYSHLIKITAKPGTTDWLRKNNLAREILGHDPNNVFAISKDLLEVLNSRITKITIHPL